MKKLVAFDLDESEWELLDAEDFSDDEKEKLVRALEQVIESSAFKSHETWGDVIGQQAPIEAQEKWDPGFTNRKMMKALLDDLISKFSVRLGGTTSVHITKLGIDKAYGIRQLRDTFGIAIEETIFIEDALFPGGNDNLAKEAGEFSIQVRDSNESKRVIGSILACLGDAQPTKPLEETRL